MAQHKAATAVTIAPTEEKSAFAQIVETFWKPAALIAGLVAIGVLGMIFVNQQAKEASDTSWDTFLSVTENQALIPTGASSEEIAGMVDELRGTEAGPWSLYSLALAYFNESRFDEALSAVDNLRTEYPDHDLNQQTYQMAGVVAPQTVLDVLETRIRDQRDWDAAHPWLLGNAELPADAPKVRITTESGDIVVGLFTEAAPEHVANFLKLCGEGYYDGTRFHRVLRGFMIQGGDPNSKEEDTTQWGQGGPDYTLAREENDLLHFAGVLSMAKKPGETESSGSQFFITTDPAHHLDGQHVVFGAVVSGMDVVEEIETAPVTAGTDKPEVAVAVTSTTVL